jgi:hypothetical protein
MLFSGMFVRVDFRINFGEERHSGQLYPSLQRLTRYIRLDRNTFPLSVKNFVIFGDSFGCLAEDCAGQPALNFVTANNSTR